MALEIERKWLVKNTPELLSNLGKLDDSPGYEYAPAEFTQGYLHASPTESVRVRVVKDLNYQDTFADLTVKKTISSTTREEHEFEIPVDQATQALNGVEHVIFKTRYCVIRDHVLFEIDVFHDSLDGLVIMEMEFAEGEDVNAPVDNFPDWVEVIREVTDDPRFLNCNLVGKCYNDICS